MARSISPAFAVTYLTGKGFSPVQAAAIVGNMMQESGLNPASVNTSEGAHGLMQWRLDRWQGLQDYAKAAGADASDPRVQLDFISHEMAGPEAKSAAPFMAATDLPSANAALKGYIRYGDDSQGTRLANAQGLLGGNNSGGSAAPSLSPTAPGAPVIGLEGPSNPLDDDNRQQQASATWNSLLADPDPPSVRLFAPPELRKPDLKRIALAPPRWRGFYSRG